MVKILAALGASLSILNSSGTSPGATKKSSGASHSSANNTLRDLDKYNINYFFQIQHNM